MNRRASLRSGMTLLEVLIATLILGIVIVGLLQGLAVSTQVFSASEFVKQASNVVALGDAAHPMEVNEDPVEDLAVSADGSLLDGWTYERICEDDEDEDGIYLIRTKVVRGHGGLGNEIEILSLFYYPEGGFSASEFGGLL